MTPVNALWTDFATLNAYVTRALSFLQDGQPDNDVLLYYPIYDRFATPGNALIEHFDGGIAPFEGMAMGDAAASLVDRGYGFDFISDRQLRAVTMVDGRLEAGGVPYRVLVLPESRYIPLETFKKIVDLASDGATVLVFRDLPADVPGLHRLDERQSAFQTLKAELTFSDTAEPGIRAAGVGDGVFLVGENLEALLTAAGVQRESMGENGLRFVRRSHDNGHTYFILNAADTSYDGLVSLGVAGVDAARFDLMTGKRGHLPVGGNIGVNRTEGMDVFLQLEPGESTVLRTFDAEIRGPSYGVFEADGPPVPLAGTWMVTFTTGGPSLPVPVTTETPASWTDLGDDAVKAFSGTATYSLTFQRPASEASGWLLDLGEVHESAVVRLNGRSIGTLIGPTFRVYVEASLLNAENTLEVDVSNLMANRIADLDRRRVPWKKFYNVNFAARLGSNRNEHGLFDASQWEPLPSGLLGPVTLTPTALR
jgi:hypothetical protein